MNLNTKNIFEVWREIGYTPNVEMLPSDGEIEKCESNLGFKLPQEIRDLYQFSNGAWVLDGNFNYEALFDGEVSFSNYSEKFREYGWVIDENIVLFGANGGSEYYGLLYRSKDDVNPVVVVIGELFEEKCMQVHSSSLLAFLYKITIQHAAEEHMDLVQKLLTDSDLDIPLGDTTLPDVMTKIDRKFPELFYDVYSDPKSYNDILGII